MPYDEDTPRLAEIGRRITEVGQNMSDFRNEVRSSFADMVRKDTYHAERDAFRDRLNALEARGRTVWGLALGSMFSVVAAILMMWISRGGA